MPIKLEPQIKQVGQTFAPGLRVGYTPQIDPSPFVRAYDSTIRAGQQAQNLGTSFGELISKQKTLADDLAYGRLVADFKNMQQENEQDLAKQAKRDPSELAPKWDEAFQSYFYLLGTRATVLGDNSRRKLLESDTFKELGQNYQQKFLELTEDLINERVIKAKLDTTKILHQAQIRQDEQEFNALLEKAKDPTISEEEFQRNVDNFKIRITNDSQRKGTRDGKQLQETLDSIDKKVTKVKYDKAKLIAFIKGTPEAIQSVAERVQKGEFGIKPENLWEELGHLYKNFNTAQEAQTKRWKEEKARVVAETETEFLLRLNSGDFTELELTNMLDEWGEEELRGEGTKLRQLRKDLKSHFKPEADPPDSISREMLLSVERVDILENDASDQLNSLLIVTQNLGESEEGLTAKEEAKITQEINKKLNSINKADATAMAAEKKKYIKRIEHRMREGKDSRMPMSSNAMAIQFVAEDLFNELLLKSKLPGADEEPLTLKEAWEIVDDLIVQVAPPMKELMLDLEALQKALEIDANELRSRFENNPDSLTDREEEALRIYTEALEAKNASLFGKQETPTGQ